MSIDRNPLRARAPAESDIPILRERALALARPQRAVRVTGGATALVFTLSHERYALDATLVREVAYLRNLTPLPVSAAPLFGVTHWRGSVLTLLDVREAFGLRTRGLTDLGRIIVIDHGNDIFGIVVDSLHDVIPIDRDRLLPVPGGDPTSRALLGVTGDGVLLIDPDYLLAWATPGDAHHLETGETK